MVFHAQQVRSCQLPLIFPPKNRRTPKGMRRWNCAEFCKALNCKRCKSVTNLVNARFILNYQWFTAMVLQISVQSFGNK